MTTTAWGSAGVVWVATLGLGCGAPLVSHADLLKTSFAEQIQGVTGVEAFARTGDELTFAYPNTDGEPVSWRVTIDSVVLDAEGEEPPAKGDVFSSWYADGELVEFLGSMSRLPDPILETGVAQECYALWEVEVGEWGW